MNESVSLNSPFLKQITLLSEKVDQEHFPFNRFPDLLSDKFSLDFPTPVTFFIGENGTGKSTVLEWCSQEPKRAIDSRFRPCDDWVLKETKWYGGLKQQVIQRFSEDYGGPRKF